MQPEDEQRGQARVHRHWKGRIVQEQDYIKEGRGKLSVRQRTDGCDRAAFSQTQVHAYHSLHDCVCMHITFHLFVSKQQSNSPLLCGHFGFVHFYHINISCRLQEKENKHLSDQKGDKHQHSVQWLKRSSINLWPVCLLNSLCCDLRL